MKNYYSILGLPSNATEEDIKRAYRKLAKQYHPDINKSPGAEEKLKEINKAYEVLTKQKPSNNFDDILKQYGFTSVNFSSAFSFNSNRNGVSSLTIDFLDVLNDEDIEKILNAIENMGYKKSRYSYSSRSY